MRSNYFKNGVVKEEMGYARFPESISTFLQAEGESEHMYPMFCIRTHNTTHFELSDRSKYAIDDVLLLSSPHTIRELNCTLPHACSGLRSKILAVSQSIIIDNL